VRVKSTADIPITTKHSERSLSSIGASQKDEVGAMVASLHSAKVFTVIGIIAFLGGVFLAFYPPAATLLGGITPGLALAGSGLALAVLPFIVIGHPVLFSVLVVTAIAAGLGIWFVHTHGGITAELAVLKTQLKKI
jgi:hypothetical protein